MKKIILYGGSGLLGTELAKSLSKKYIIYKPSHTEIDVTKKEAIKKQIEMIKPDFILYTAGISRIDEAEKNPQTANLLNAEIPIFLAKIAAKMKISFYYFSTDAVFEGTPFSKPYKETDKPNPLSTYGKTKRKGEEGVLAASNKHVVIRVIMLYSAHFKKKQDFARFVLKSLQKKLLTIGITDQLISPLYVPTAVKAVEKLLTNNAHGIYHLASTDTCSNFTFTQKLATLFKLNEKLVTPMTLTDFQKTKPALRAQFACLDTSKFVKKFGEDILHSTDDDLLQFKKAYNT